MGIDYLDEDMPIENERKPIPKLKIFVLTSLLMITILLVYGSIIVFYNGDVPSKEIIYNSADIINYTIKENIVTEIEYENNDLSIKLEERNIVDGSIKEVGFFELKSHKEINEILRVAPGEQVVMYYDFNFNEAYTNGLGNVRFIDQRKGEEVNRDYSFVYWEEEEYDEPIYDTVCSNPITNGTNGCSLEVVRTESRTRGIWLPYNSRDIPTGQIRIGLKTEVLIDDYVDGIWTIGGKEITKHAEWTVDLNVGLVSFWKLNETTIDVKDSLGRNNGTALNSTIMVGRRGIINASATINPSGSTSGIMINTSGTTIHNLEQGAISAWVNYTGNTVGGDGHYIMGYNETGGSNYAGLRLQGDTNPNSFIYFYSEAFNGAINTTNNLNNTGWRHIVVSFNRTQAYFYLDGNLTGITSNTSGSLNFPTVGNPIIGARVPNAGGLNPFNTGLDEIGFYNRTLSSSQVQALYNNGLGITYDPNPIVTNLNVSNSLISPANGFNTGSANLGFTGNHTALNGNLTNATLYIWYGNTTLFGRNSTVINGTTNSTNLSLGGFSLGNYLWNYYTCAVNSSSYICNMPSTNYTFTKSGFNTNSENYSINVYETQHQLFTLNITTLPGILSVTSYLNYNGTRHLASTTCNSGNCFIQRNIDIPLVTSGNIQNKSFFWEMALFDGTSILQQNLSSNQQNVSRIFLELSNATYSNHTLNFTTYDERNRTRLTNMSLSATFSFWLGNGSVQRNSSFNVPNSVEVNLAIQPHNVTFFTDAYIEYNAVGVHTDVYTERNYNFQRASLTNSTQHIKLFLWNNNFSTSFIQRVIDTSQLPVEGALVFIQRYYPEDNTYETVSITRTNNNGESIGLYEIEVPEYKHIITKNGTLLKTTELGKIFPESAPFTLNFIIGESFGNGWEAFEGITDLFSNLSYNATTQVVSYTWIDTTGALSIANLTVEKINLNTSNSLVCSQSSILGAGTLTCNVTGQSGTLVAKTYIGRSPSVLDQVITFAVETLSGILGRPFLFLWILLMIASIAAGLFYPPVSIFLLGMTTILGSILGVVSVGWIFIWAIIAVGIFILWETR